LDIECECNQEGINHNINKKFRIIIIIYLFCFIISSSIITKIPHFILFFSISEELKKIKDNFETAFREQTNDIEFTN